MRCGYFYTTSFWYRFLSVSLSLPVCDVGFGNNKWLDVFRCHVKPGEGHVLSEHTTAAGGSLAPRSGFWVHTVCVEAPTPAEWALCQVSVTSERGLRSKVRLFFFFNWSWLVPCPEPVLSMLVKDEGRAGDTMVPTGYISLLMRS